MAKGNLFLGVGRRSVGDVVFYVRNGEQVSRVRRRQIANPKSDGQALQRSYTAAVSKFYSFFKSPLERSWQGLNRSQSQSAFLKANLNLIRQEGYYVTKGFGIAPLPLQVSKGTLQRVGATIDSSGSVKVITGVSSPIVGTPETLGSLSQAFIAKGYAAGDQVTFVIVTYDDDPGYLPRWLRFVLDPSSTVEIGGEFARIGVGFNITAGEELITEYGLFGSGVDIAAAAVIVSRYSGGEWQRSTEYMAADEGYIRNFIGEEARAAAIASYQAATAVPESDVYLNGSTEESTEPVPTGVADFTVTYVSGDVTGTVLTRQQVMPRSIKVGAEELGSNILVVRCTNQSSGSTMLLPVVNRATGDQNRGKVLDMQGNWQTPAVTSFAFLPVTGETDPLVEWLDDNYEIGAGFNPA